MPAVALAVSLTVVAAVIPAVLRKPDEAAEARRDSGGAPHGPNVVLITFCTLRADRIGCYGYDRADTPNFGALAKAGVVFDNHYTQASYSGGAFASILTGRYCSNHGVFDHPRKLAADNTTLAELLAAAGYQTAAFVTHNFVSERFDYHQGFGAFSHHRNALGQAKQAASWIEQHADRPFFLWYQSQPGHYPYRGPQHLIPPEAEPIDFAINRHHKMHGNSKRAGARLMFDFDSLGYTDHQFASMMTLYDVTVAMADRFLAEIGRALKSAGVLGKTLVIMVADHGEALGEHGFYFNHAANLYEPTVRVPLIIRWPGRELAGRRVSAVTQNVDILPTVADMVGLEPPAEIDGLSLLPVLAGDSPPRDAFCESGVFRRSRAGLPNYRQYLPGVPGKWRMIRRGDHKLICVPGEGDDRAATYELYDLGRDPGELTNLASARPGLRDRLAASLEAWFSGYADADTTPAAVDQEDLDALRSLGYID